MIEFSLAYPGVINYDPAVSMIDEIKQTIEPMLDHALIEVIDTVVEQNGS